jgi:hypothetical protein
MNFEQWQATGRDVPDINQVIDTCNGEMLPGRVYEGDLYIENGDKMDRWFLTIGNSQYADDDLESLERILFDWAVDEGFFEEVN